MNCFLLPKGGYVAKEMVHDKLNRTTSTGNQDEYQMAPLSPGDPGLFKFNQSCRIPPCPADTSIPFQPPPVKQSAAQRGAAAACRDLLMNTFTACRTRTVLAADHLAALAEAMKLSRAECTRSRPSTITSMSCARAKRRLRRSPCACAIPSPAPWPARMN